MTETKALQPLSPDEMLKLCQTAVGWLLYLRQGAWDFPRFEAVEAALPKMRLVPFSPEVKAEPVDCTCDHPCTYGGNGPCHTEAHCPMKPSTLEGGEAK